MVYDNRQPSIYLNGKLVKTGLPSARATVNAPTSVGYGSYGNFNGTVDEIRVVAKSLNEEGIRDAMGEVCDDGSSNAEVLYGAAVCNTDCMINAHCGDGFVSNGEACDEGTTNGTAGRCKADCSGYDCIPGVHTFTYTGDVQTFDVQHPGTYTIEAWGAQGMSNAMGVAGGKGGYAVAKVSVTKGDVLNIYIGAGGDQSSTGGWNGGGNAGASGCTAAVGGGGGGASDVRKNGTELGDRILVGAGGGGAGGNRRDGCGAGTGGGGGGGYYGGGGGGSWNANIVATGGSQSYGGTGGSGGIGDSGLAGALGIGGAGGGCATGSQSAHDTAAVGGAGGGTTGNNGICAGNFTGGSGAGGSSYIHAAGNTESSTTADNRTGNGEVKITITCP